MNDLAPIAPLPGRAQSGEPVSPAAKGPRAGRVVSTADAQIIILLDRDVCAHGLVEMGSLVCVRSPQATVYGVIEGLSTPMPLAESPGTEMKMAEICLLGEVADDDPAGHFRRGVSKIPSLDSVVHLADREGTAVVYALPGRASVAIGTVHQDPRVHARVSVDDMLCKHFAMLGTTGTGKSCALTLMLKRILDENPNGHVLLLDPHGEYGTAFADRAELLGVETFRLPYWLCTFEELTELVFGADRHERSAEIIHLREIVLAAKLAFAGGGRDANRITVDTPVPYTLGDLNRFLDQATGSLDNRANLDTYLRLKSRLSLLQTDRRYAFMFDVGLVVRDDFTQWLGRLLRVPAGCKPLAILDLGGIASEVLNVVVAVICRLAFDVASLAGQRVPLLLVCEEAHRYAPRDTELGFEPAKRALSRIAKEGRKYGIGLGLVSQRPSELASSILSQCNTVFAFRMASERDQDIIRATLADGSPGLFNALAFLGNAEALAIGEGVPVPMRLRFADLAEDERPRSSSASFSRQWRAGSDEASEIQRIVEGLRGRQIR